MRKLINLSLLAALTFGAIWLYQTKYQTIGYVTKISRLKQEIVKEREFINRLEADWTFLNRPDYLQPLVERHLSMKPMALSQIGLGSLAERPAPLPDPLTKMLEAMGQANKEIQTAKIIKAPVQSQKLAIVKPPSLKTKAPLPRFAAKPKKTPDLSDYLASLEPQAKKRAKP
jgi:hypothetical protein